MRALLCLLIVLIPAPSAAVERCGLRAQIVKVLAEKYGESQTIVLRASARAVVEIWRNLKSDNWTILVTTTTGMSCITAVGKGWADIPPEEGDPT